MKTLEPEDQSKMTDPEKNAEIYRRELEIDVLARTIWGEARGEGTTGMQAVAAVVMNRLKHARARGGYWWGDDIIEICQKPYQFSAWNKDDPNFEKISAVTDNNLQFATAKRLARRAVYGVMDDPTNGATHYHAIGVTPLWSHREKPVAVIGRHIFYRLEVE